MSNNNSTILMMKNFGSKESKKAQPDVSEQEIAKNELSWEDLLTMSFANDNDKMNQPG